MKTIIGALALILATPVAAQTAPAGDPHSQHHPQPSGAPVEHKMDCECCKDMKQGKDCCDKHAKEHATQGSQPTK